MKCKMCGKTIPPDKKYCSRECFLQSRKKGVATNQKSDLSKLSNETRCLRCGKLLDINRMSCYCEVCENNYEITIEDVKIY